MQKSVTLKAVCTKLKVTIWGKTCCPPPPASRKLKEYYQYPAATRSGFASWSGKNFGDILFFRMFPNHLPCHPRDSGRCIPPPGPRCSLRREDNLIQCSRWAASLSVCLSLNGFTCFLFIFVIIGIVTFLWPGLPDRVGRSVCHNFQNGREVTLPCSWN